MAEPKGMTVWAQKAWARLEEAAKNNSLDRDWATGIIFDAVHLAAETAHKQIEAHILNGEKRAKALAQEDLTESFHKAQFACSRVEELIIDFKGKRPVPKRKP